jgi:hypothetical protein
MNVSLMKKPSGFVPMAMSLAALGIVLGHAAIYGIVHEADEGAAAHIFQILIVAQVPIVAYFAIKWLPRATMEAVRVLALQCVAVIAAFASVYWLT